MNEQLSWVPAEIKEKQTGRVITPEGIRDFEETVSKATLRLQKMRRTGHVVYIVTDPRSRVTEMRVFKPDDLAKTLSNHRLPPFEGAEEVVQALGPRIGRVSIFDSRSRNGNGGTQPPRQQHPAR